MVDVLVTVGVFSTFEDVRDNAIKMSLPRIPEIGDMIVPDGRLLEVIERKKKEWNMMCGINYVRTIAYYGSAVVVMLGGNPSTISVDLYYNDKIAGGQFDAVPRVGEFVYVQQFNEKNYLYVSQITYNASHRVVGVFLTDNPQTPAVRVDNCVDVNVGNVVDVNVTDRVQLVEPVDVKIVDQYGTLDVRTRREAYD
ncbi:MAG: hypothetical protein J6J93_02305 [Muribaculaceae bacterium]|nr:hypothetical protein [Muribaculaceae bacterium]